MEWKKLISNTRLGCESAGGSDNRNSYNRDFDRIIFSKEFRMLQSKTQVVPFPEKDSTHTRLTHSLETASVGRSLGIIAADKIGLKTETIDPNDIGASIAAACICHDIGNPPLGHSGEKAISEFFLSEGRKFLDGKIKHDDKFDFENFEGNAIGFNILTHSNYKKTDVTGGFGLTYTTLAAFTKYPNRLKDKKGFENIAYAKKPGILKCDLNTFRKIATELGLCSKDKDCWCRHPLAYLTEAADDICYAIVDLEDGYRNNRLSFNDTSELLMGIIKSDPKTSYNDEKIKDNTERIGYMRAKAINALINLTTDVFFEKRELILSGDFKDTLVSNLPSEANQAYENLIENERNKVYTDKNILLTEAAGFCVLPGLLNILLSAAFGKDAQSKKIQTCLIKDLICNDESIEYEDRNYITILNIVKYISLMTDHYAVKLYRELTGIQLPNY